MKDLRSYLKYLLPALIVIMIAGLLLSRMDWPDPASTEPEVRIKAKEAIEYIGKAAEVCGKVASLDYLPQINGEPTFLNLGRPYPSQYFTAVIWGSDRARWNTSPDQQYENRNICVTGRIELYEGTPQIIVESPRQVEIQTDKRKNGN